jgi:hypothetical protein
MRYYFILSFLHFAKIIVLNLMHKQKIMKNTKEHFYASVNRSTRNALPRISISY